jgi:hypothetical protein
MLGYVIHGLEAVNRQHDLQEFANLHRWHFCFSAGVCGNIVWAERFLDIRHLRQKIYAAVGTVPSGMFLRTWDTKLNTAWMSSGHQTVPTLRLAEDLRRFWYFVQIVTYLRSWALLEKPQIVQPLKNFPAFYGTRRFITVFTRAFHGPYPEPDLSSPHHPIPSL